MDGRLTGQFVPGFTCLTRQCWRNEVRAAYVPADDVILCHPVGDNRLISLTVISCTNSFILSGINTSNTLSKYLFKVKSLSKSLEDCSSLRVRPHVLVNESTSGYCM